MFAMMVYEWVEVWMFVMKPHSPCKSKTFHSALQGQAQTRSGGKDTTSDTNNLKPHEKTRLLTQTI